MERVHMRLTAPQAKKLMKGGVVQISPDALQSNSHWLVLEKKTANKVRRAKRSGKGCRIHLSPTEMDHCGGSLADFFKKVKDGAQWLKKNVIDTSAYQQSIKPIVRKVINQGIETFVPTSIGRDAAHQVANFVGDQTAAFGIKEQFASAKNLYEKHAKKYVAPHLRRAALNAERALVNRAKKMAPQYASDIDKLHEEYGERAVDALGKRTGAFGLRKGRGLQKDYSNFLNPSHPAMRPMAAALPPIGGWVYMYPVGGSFKPSGGSFMPSG